MLAAQVAVFFADRERRGDGEVGQFGFGEGFNDEAAQGFGVGHGLA